ncbi:MAG: insulinase family protein, partial [Muribaculaceae bacterium]|nr:insulinase family protein [Muribaculaceae bacterium]
EHPYSWPTIGLEPGHIARVTVEDAQRWFYSHYAPNNAILAIAGNVDFDTACRRAEEWFADVPSREIAQRRQPDPGFPAQAVTETVRGDVPYPLITIGIPMTEYGRPEYFAADTITDILSVGRSGRLRNNLVNGPARGLIAEADASIIGSEGPGLLLLTFSVLSDTDADIERAIELTWREVRRMGRPGDVSDRELQRTLNNFESTFRFSNINYLSKATNLAQAELHGEDLNRTVSDRRALTPADIERESRRLFEDTPPVTLIYRPR